MTISEDHGAARNFDGASVLITGGSSGVGLACARLFASNGAHVMITARNAEKLSAAQNELNDISPHTRWLAGQVENSTFANQLIDETINAFGRLDVVINAAGIILRRDCADTTDEEWRNIMRVNLDGSFFVCRAGSRAMSDGGSVVNVSSTCGIVGAAGLAAYNTSKGAINQLTKSLALELAPRRITVNAVAPGAIESPMLFSEHAGAKSDEDIVRDNLASIPIGTIATPREVARSIHFLASEPHITGCILSVDGGYTAQ